MMPVPPTKRTSIAARILLFGDWTLHPKAYPAIERGGEGGCACRQARGSPEHHGAPRPPIQRAPNEHPGHGPGAHRGREEPLRRSEGVRREAPRGVVDRREPRE